MKLSQFFTAFLLAVATTAPATGQPADDCSGSNTRFAVPDASSNCMTDDWTNAKGTEKIYPDDFAIKNAVTVYTCPVAGKRVIVSNGIPDHDLVIQQNNDGPCEVPFAVELPLNPEYDAGLGYTELPVRGIIAMAKNGVPAFGPQESESLNAVEAYETEKIDATFWYGHRGPDHGWHTHNPNMGNEFVDSTTFLGWAMDGFEIYGPLSDAEVNNGDLDECNGKVGDDGKYRYHVRTIDQVDGEAEYCVSGYNNLDNDPRIHWKYILGCYSGDVSQTTIYDSGGYAFSSDCIVEGTPTASPTAPPTRDPNAPPRPNIIIMQPDDLVFMDEWTPPPNNPETPDSTNTFPTAGMPNIDELRTGGLQMMQAYTASPMCGTSRYSTITGKMPGRSLSIRDKFDAQPSEVTIPNTKLNDDDCEKENLAVALKSEGYATAMIGKWHLSKIDRDDYTYTEAVETVGKCGFDFVSGLYMENMEDKNGLNQYVTGEFSHNMEWITHEAIKFINTTTSQSDPEPFFMYFNPTVPHGSQNVLEALEDFECTDTAEGDGGDEPWIKGMSEDAGCEAYRDTVIERADGENKALGKIWLDDSVGALVQALKDNGVYENTIFVFQEDHGMDAKGTLYENGIRIPQFVHYPNGISAGTVLDAPVSTVDVAATMMDYAGIDVSPYNIDGTSWKDVIGNTEREDFWKNERCLFFEIGYDRAVRCGCYKYVHLEYESGETFDFGDEEGYANNIGGMLFDLCDGTDDYITDNDNNQEIDLVDNIDLWGPFMEAYSCYQDKTDPGSAANFGACGSTEAPTSSPTPTQSYDCTTDNGEAGVVFELELQVDAKSGTELSWSLVNELVETSGWEASSNLDFPADVYLKYSICLPLEECWILSLSDTGGDGLGDGGYYKGYVAGKEIFDGKDFGSSVDHDICIGRSEYCRERDSEFIYRIPNRRGKIKKKRIDCDTLGNRKKTKNRDRKEICAAKFGRKGSAKVKTQCMEACGKIGQGGCGFLKKYGDDGFETVAPGNMIQIGPANK